MADPMGDISGKSEPFNIGSLGSGVLTRDAQINDYLSTLPINDRDAALSEIVNILGTTAGGQLLQLGSGDGGLGSLLGIGSGIAQNLPGQGGAFNRDVLGGLLSNVIGAATSSIGNTAGLTERVNAAYDSFPAGKWYDPDTGLEIPNFDPKTGAGMGTLFPTFVPDSDAGGGSTAAEQTAAEETVDLTADTTANELLTIGSGDGSLGDAADLGTVSQDATVDQETVSDVNETWTYNKATDSFISSTRGDSIPNRGNAELKDGGVYAVTPVLGTDGVMAENVVDTETNESVGVFSIDINTGLPTITNKAAADKAAAAKAAAAKAAADKAAADKAAVIVDETVVNDTVVTTPTVITGTDGNDGNDGNDGTDGNDGRDGRDGGDGTDGRDGKDGKDGMIGLFSSIQNTPLTDSIFFEPQFTELDNIPVGMFERFLQATGGR